MSERRKIVETVLDTESYEWGREQQWPDQLVEFIGWLQELLERVPPEHRENAEIDFKSEYDSSCVDIEVTYSRPETEEEWLTRVRQEQESRTHEAAEMERHERLTLKLLLEKYGAP